ncbi:hypothetical protein [Nostoc sp.]
MFQPWIERLRYLGQFPQMLPPCLTGRYAADDGCVAASSVSDRLPTSVLISGKLA